MATYQTVTSDDKIDVAPDLARATESLRAAATLHKAGLAADSVTRAHQAMIHAERALLCTEKRCPQDVHGVHRMATLHFLQTDLIPREHLAAVERTAILRARADDLPHGRISAAESAEALEAASAFVAAAEAWLRHERFIPAAAAAAATDGAK